MDKHCGVNLVWQPQDFSQLLAMSMFAFKHAGMNLGSSQQHKERQLSRRLYTLPLIQSLCLTLGILVPNPWSKYRSVMCVSMSYCGYSANLHSSKFNINIYESMQKFYPEAAVRCMSEQRWDKPQSSSICSTFTLSGKHIQYWLHYYFNVFFMLNIFSTTSSSLSDSAHNRCGVIQHDVSGLMWRATVTQRNLNLLQTIRDWFTQPRRSIRLDQPPGTSASKRKMSRGRKTDREILWGRCRQGFRNPT